MGAPNLRSPLWGWERDFLAVDEVGSVALLSSAGYGPMPQSVLENRPIVESRRETAYLMRSPTDARRLSDAMERPVDIHRRRRKTHWVELVAGPQQPAGSLLGWPVGMRGRTLRRQDGACAVDQVAPRPPARRLRGKCGELTAAVRRLARAPVGVLDATSITTMTTRSPDGRVDD